MRSLYILAVLFLTVATGGAQAQSADGVLLQRLKRLEGEVAALKAALAKRAPSQRHTAVAPLPEPDRPAAKVVTAEAPVSLPQSPADPFAGFYVAPFGGASEGLKRTESSNLASQFNLNWSALNPVEFGVAAGYNVTSGRLLFGAETAWRYEVKNGASYTNSSVAPLVFVASGSFYPLVLPYVTDYCFFGVQCFGYSTTSGPPLPTSQVTTDRLRIEQRGGGELVGRVGAEFGDWLFYSRLGAGASQFWQQRTTTTAVQTCQQPVYQNQGYIQYLISCGALTTATKTTSSAQTDWLPYFILGFGAEANFGRYFARAEANMQQYIGDSNRLGIANSFARYDGRMALGLRF